MKKGTISTPNQLVLQYLETYFAANADKIVKIKNERLTQILAILQGKPLL